MHFQVSAETFETTTSGLVIWHTGHFPSGLTHFWSNWSIDWLLCTSLPTLTAAHWFFFITDTVLLNPTFAVCSLTL